MAVLTMNRDNRPADVPADLLPVGAKLPTKAYLKSMWERRDFIVAVPLGQLRAQNQNTVFGNFWHLLNPVLLAGVYYLIFGVLFPAGSRGGIENYAGYLITGIFGFTYLNKGIMAGTRTVTANLSLIQQISFPRSALPLSAMVVETVAQGPAIIALIFLVLITGSPFSLTWLLLIPTILIQAVFLLGCCFFVARATFHFRDVEQLLPFLLRIWMYMSGLFFALSLVVDKLASYPDWLWLRTVFELNPAWLFMALWRNAMLGTVGEPVGAAPWWYWAAACAWALATVVAGFFWFRANETEYSRGG